MHAAQNYGVHVTTTTISDEQHEFAAKRIRNAGLEDRITLLKKDYRDLSGKFDKLVSIEMIEAVGHHFYETFFQTCSRLLKDDGMMALQAITIGDQIFDRHKRSVDFIKRYIFPGSCIPSITAISNAIAGATDLRLVHWRTSPRTMPEPCVNGADGFSPTLIRFGKWVTPTPSFGCGNTIYVIVKADLRRDISEMCRCFLPNPCTGGMICNLLLNMHN